MNFHYLSLIGLFTICFVSCDVSERDTKPETDTQTYSNNFFQVHVPENWEILDSSEDEFLLVLSKNNLTAFNPNLIFTVVNAEEYVSNYDIQDFTEFVVSKKNHFSDKADYRLVHETSEVVLGDNSFMLTEYEILDKQIIQKHYDFDLGQFYLTISSTEKKQEPEKQLEELIASISFAKSKS